MFGKYGSLTPGNIYIRNLAKGKSKIDLVQKSATIEKQIF